LSFKHNILANYVSQAYVTLIGVVMVPLYIRHMGAEAYGLVGFFTMLQAWFQLLDMGLTPTMARATAQYRGGVSDALSLRRLLRALEGIFFITGIVAAVALALASGVVASDWLHVQKLPLSQVSHSLMLIAAIVALRWIAGLYRGAVSGFEKMVWLSGFNIAIATARFVLPLPMLIAFGGNPVYFFCFQLVVAFIEIAFLTSYTYRLMPQVDARGNLPWDWKPLRGVLKFSLSIAFTSSVWVLVTQTDKLVLSKLLPLSEYAYFTLGVLVAGAVNVLSGPVGTALLPRLTRVAAEGNEPGVIELYRSASQLVAMVTIPAAVVLALFSEQVLWAWTGDRVVAGQAAPVLALYSAGNGILSLAAFPYYLQYAKGNLRLHLIGNALFVVFLIPGLIFATLKFGVVGAGCAWFGANLSYFLLWVPLVHRKLQPGLHFKWITSDIGKPLLATILAACFAKEVLSWPQNRFAIGVMLAAIGLALVVVAASVTRLVAERIRPRLAQGLFKN
jgi:O-antigen/teichoic acid export membrane protein